MVGAKGCGGLGQHSIPVPEQGTLEAHGLHVMRVGDKFAVHSNKYGGPLNGRYDTYDQAEAAAKELVQ